MLAIGSSSQEREQFRHGNIPLIRETLGLIKLNASNIDHHNFKYACKNNCTLIDKISMEK
jgi:hypothetical protein